MATVKKGVGVGGLAVLMFSPKLLCVLSIKGSLKVFWSYKSTTINDSRSPVVARSPLMMKRLSPSLQATGAHFCPEIPGSEAG